MLCYVNCTCESSSSHGQLICMNGFLSELLLFPRALPPTFSSHLKTAIFSHAGVGSTIQRLLEAFLKRCYINVRYEWMNELTNYNTKISFIVSFINIIIININHTQIQIQHSDPLLLLFFIIIKNKSNFFIIIKCHN